MKCPLHEKCPYRDRNGFCLMEDYGMDPHEECDAFLWEYEDESEDD